MTGRLYIQYRPQGSPDTLLRWQRELAHENTRGRPVPANQFHLTIIHFGVLTDIFHIFKKMNPALSWEEFMTAIDRFIAVCEAVCPTETTVRPLRPALYGMRRTTLVLEMEPDEQLRKAHGVCLGALIGCLAECGLSDPEGYMRTDQNFMFAFTFRPHMTILKNAHRIVGGFPEQAINLTLMPAKYGIQSGG